MHSASEWRVHLYQINDNLIYPEWTCRSFAGLAMGTYRALCCITRPPTHYQNGFHQLSNNNWGGVRKAVTDGGGGEGRDEWGGGGADSRYELN